MAAPVATRPPWKVELALAAGALALALAASAVVLRGAGWPYNHDYLAPFQRTEWFRRAFLAGDPFPLWSPFCFNGHGTPGPFFYHRLFFTVSGALALALGSVRAVPVTIVLFLWVGALGMVRLGRELGWPAPLKVAGAALLVLAPYTYVDWLVRGAVAELSAAMLVPWLLVHALRAMRGERAGVALGVTAALLFYAHLVIGLYAAIVLAIAAAVAIRRERGVENLLLAALVLALTTGLYALAIRRLGRYYSLDALKALYPTDKFQATKRYLTLPDYRWGEQWTDFSVEISRGVLLALVVIAPAAALARRGADRLALLLAGGTFLACFILQLPPAAPFYLHVPFADVIQFPWRLLAFMTPCAIVLLGEAAASLARGSRRWQRALAVTGVAVALAYQGALAARAQRIRYPWFTRDAVERAVRDLDGPWVSEFLPVGLERGTVPPRAPFLRLDGCALRAASPRTDLDAPHHFRRIELDLASAGACRVLFSQFAGPFVAIEGVSPDRVRRMADGTVEITAGPGERRLVIRQRGLIEALLAGW
jgi:hypothetical protein